MSKEKRQKQLGMNPATASGRLVRDMLFKMICDTDQNKCHYCSEQMSREDFNITHKDAWLDSKDPVGLYFDLDNVTFAHTSCVNRNAKRLLAECGTVTKFANGCRCDDCTEAKRIDRAKYYSPEVRRDKYLRNQT